MTPRERDLLALIERRIAADGVAPTYREMAEGLGLCGAGSVHSAVSSLIRQGRLRRRPFASRGLEVVARGSLGSNVDDDLLAELRRRGYSVGAHGSSLRAIVADVIEALVEVCNEIDGDPEAEAEQDLAADDVGEPCGATWLEHAA